MVEVLLDLKNIHSQLWHWRQNHVDGSYLISTMDNCRLNQALVRDVLCLAGLARASGTTRRELEWDQHSTWYSWKVSASWCATWSGAT